MLPGKEGLLHISEISTKHIGKVEDVFAPGDHVIVEVKEIDDQNRINLSRRRLLADPALIESAGLTQYLPAEEERDKMIAALPDASAPSRDRTPRRDGDRERRGDRGPFRRDRR